MQIEVRKWLESLLNAPVPRAIGDAIAAHPRVSVTGTTGAFPMALVAAWQWRTPRPLIVVCRDKQSANLWIKNLGAFLGGNPQESPSERGIYAFEEQEPFVPDFFSQQELDGLISRYQTLEKLLYTPNAIVVTTPAALRLPLVSVERFRQNLLELKPGQVLPLKDLREKLEAIGYRLTTAVHEPGEVSIRGGIVDVFPVGADDPVRLDFFGDELESIRRFDPIGQISREELTAILISPLFEARTRSAEELIDFEQLAPDQLAAAEIDLPRGLDRMSSAYYAQLDKACLVDYLPANALVLSEVVDLAGAVNELRQELFPPMASLVESDLLPRTYSDGPSSPGWELPFLAPEDLAARMAKARTCFFAQPLDEQLPDGPVIACPQEPLQRGLGALTERVSLLLDQCKGFETLLSSLAEPRLAAEFERPLAAIRHARGDALGGFLDRANNLALLTDEEIFPQKVHPLSGRRRKRLTQKDLEQIHVGDYIVHVNHGVGIFRGIEKVAREGVVRDYLKLEYADNDLLRVPIDHLELVYKYTAGEGNAPGIHRLGGQDWAATKARIKKSLQKIAEDLLRLYRTRAQREGHSFGADTPWQAEVEDAFEYQETEGQVRAMAEIKRDMESAKPMDRLVCGEVGYGKTELAVRAAIKAVLDGTQVAILAPTTVLAQQHFLTFSRRFRSLPIRIEMLSRLRSSKEIKGVIHDLNAGKVDLVIGTHRLLSKDVHFPKLGLLVVDEEQKFGVTHKERIKLLKATVDVLTLTATPIPRTLYMSLVGLRDISLIDTPPPGRLPIRTIIKKYDDAVVGEAIRRELARGGQIFYLYNRVETIHQIEQKLRRLVPEARIIVGHGQMAGPQLEEVMLQFLSGSFDILLCTTIIENGLDIPAANTLIVENAQNFGLAQLHQLRGRVGRSSEQAFAYFLYPTTGKMTPIGRQRLEALATFSHLGAGYEIARRDLELRGAGNILGPEQHGFVGQVGLEVYCRLVNETIAELEGALEPGSGSREADTSRPVIELPFDSRIPEHYIPANQQRVDFYKRILPGIDAVAAEALRQELEDRYGEPPEELRRLLQLARLKPTLRALDLSAVRYDNLQRRLEFRWDDHRQIRPYTMRAGLHVIGRPLNPQPWGWTLTAPATPGVLLQLLEAAIPVLAQGSSIALVDEGELALLASELE